MSRRIRKVKAGRLVVRSGFEAKVVQNLRDRDVSFEYENLKLKYTVPAKEHTYTPDIELSNRVIIECKGKFDPDARKKMLLVRDQNPDRDIRILLMRDQPIRKGSDTYYSTWCRKHGFVFAVKEVPEEWLD